MATPRPVARLVPDLTRRALGRRSLALAALLRDWSRIVGAEYAHSTAPIRVSWPRGRQDGGTLTLRVFGGAAALIQHLEPQLKQRVNAHFGHPAIARIKLVQAGDPARAEAPGAQPRRPRPPRPQAPRPQAARAQGASRRERADLAAIPHDGLRAALDELAAAMEAERAG